MEKTKNWDEAESLQLIRSMIESTKYQVYSDRFLYFLWGYATLACAATHYLLAFVIGYEHPYVVWLIMPLISVIHFIYIRRKVNSSQVVTFPGRVMQGIWGGMFMAVIGMVIGAFHIGWEFVYPVFMMLYGVACFSTGSALQNKYLNWGGILSIALGVFAFFLIFQFQLLLLMLAIIVSYIAPAHLMKPNN
ncbi:hypothetical protein [Aquiflexum sp.]|uniref:hypothetical protein n=1 Tax=Aquiflexum sp. TaxID=1872584 RepID=UPI00359428D5